ncbi:penicillin-binding protein 2 [Bacillaceae bacterium Marseille-Q3522]|nr:penicillin-binding protein 2 [Bacillaceae bacterium Marseille-Q3522]
MLIFRLGVVQIAYGDEYKKEVERTENITVQSSVPRGKMYDTTGKTVVDNVPENAITYTNNGASREEMLDTAEKLAKLITMDTSKVQVRDKKDYWIIKNPDRASAKVSEKEKTSLNETLSRKEFDKKVYALTLERITDGDLIELTEQDIEIIAVYREFTSGYQYTKQIVKNKDVTPEEFALVSENLGSLPGVNTSTDWERSYPYADTLRSVLGRVSNAEEGIPAEQLDYYLSRGYSRDDRVGTSYLELQYEEVLQGKKEKVKNITDQQGNIIDTEIVSSGQSGNDLVLTLDLDLQSSVEKIIEEELKAAKQTSGTNLLDRAYVVLMDPNTGEILTMAGKRLEKDEKTGNVTIVDDALGNITTTYNVGSAVKGATVLTGYRTGAIKPGQVFYDTPVKIQGTPVKKSWKNLGSVNDIDALKFSSNVYMFHTAINIGKGNYEYNQPLSINPQAFQVMRDSFAQFGLGVRTGIDLPNEQSGFKGNSVLPGFLLDFSIGQYDTYSTMQLAQYVSTIANGGNRMEPHLVKEIHKPAAEQDGPGALVQEIKPKVLNRLDVEESWLERVQQGFQKVMQESGGTAASYFGSAAYSPAGKTGTAQAFYDGPERSKYDQPPEVMNLSLVGYAPSNNPEVAMAVLVPWAYQGSNDPRTNLKIGKRVMDTYFSLKEQRQKDANNGE